MNLACAWGLPGAEQLDVEGCIRTLDEWAEDVRRYTQWAADQEFRANPAAFENSCGLYRAAALVTYLQQKVGLQYDHVTSQSDDFLKDSRNLFIHGVIQTRRGTCSSLPPLYVAVGRRLGYPLKLVSTCFRLFVRWEGEGERFNVECTSRGLNTYPDEHYLHWPKAITREEAERHGLLKAFTRRGELALFSNTRGNCWLANARCAEAAASFAWAHELAPEIPAYQGMVQKTIRHWQEKLRKRFPEELFPRMDVYLPPRQFPALPVEVEGQFYHLDMAERLLEDPRYQAAWWRPIKLNPGVPPPGYPRHITIRYPRQAGQLIEVTFDSNVPAR